MKKYLFGALAIVLAIGFSAFTKPVRKAGDMYVFKFNTNTGTTISQTSVETESNWIYRGVEDQDEPQTICDQVDEQACEIGILDSRLDIAPASLLPGDRLDLVASSVVVNAALEGGLVKYAVHLPTSPTIYKDLDTEE